MHRVNRLPDLVDGAAVWFAGESEPFTVQARNDRLIVCTRPIPGQAERQYTIIDAEDGFRGTDGFVFPLGYDTPEACRRSLEKIGSISHRNRACLDIRRVEAAPKN